MKNKSIFVIILLLIVVSIVYSVSLERQKISITKKLFSESLTQVQVDAALIESIPLTSIYRNGKDWFHVNSSDANFRENIYYTPNGSLGNGKSATLEEFLQSTTLTKGQAEYIFGVMVKYPFVDKITSDPNISGPCANSAHQEQFCRAIKFYIASTPFNIDGITEGYVYIPFLVNDNGNKYILENFSKFKQVSDSWYNFSGEH